ncbi:MAG: HNH endonuclease [Firmicutes bacterium]|nr:HNH endonuclease [Bacillota bacterium]
MDRLSAEDAWRGILLFGYNTATYKVALARCLVDYAQAGLTRVSREQLAHDFFRLYRERARNGRPQILQSGRLTVMERVVQAYQAGRLDEDAAVDRIRRKAFLDVIPRFHTVGHHPLNTRFYEADDDRLVLTDELPRLLERIPVPDLHAALEGRWSLLEGAFTVHHHHFRLENDIRAFYLRQGHERTSLTHLRPVLHSYQEGRCFYCGEELGTDPGEVDHVIPRSVLQHDQVWNLVLAHSLCNGQKNDLLPGRGFLEKLRLPNEHLIASNHPLKNAIVAKLGGTPRQRRQALDRYYRDAEAVMPLTWERARGYDPATDPLLRRMNQFLGMVNHDGL